MALNAAIIFEVRTTGSDTNGGGFKAGATGTDWSQQDSPQYAVTDGVTNGTTTITSATANFGTDVVGNVMYVQGGTGSVAAARYEITARNSSTSVTVDRSTGLTAGTGVTLNIGGALGSPGQASGAGLVTGHTVYVKAGTYSITSASTSVSGGCFSTASGVLLEGYQTTRGDLGTPPLLQASGISTFTLVSLSDDNGGMVRNIRVDGAGLTSSRGFALRGPAYKCIAENCTNNGFAMVTASPTVIACKATGCSTGTAFSSCNCFGCVADSNTANGFSAVTSTKFVNCIASNNSGASSDGFTQSDTQNIYINCTAYNNGRNGFRAALRETTFINCVAEANGSTGFTVANVNAILLLNCAGYNNGGSGDVSLGTGTIVFNIGFISGTSSFFNNAAGGDFTLNNTAGGGASLRGAGYPGTLP